MPNPSTNLEKIHFYFREYESPEHFITVDYLYCIASCLGRRVMMQEGQPIFPNEYFVIVGPPAVGKSLPARKMFNKLAGIMKTNEGGKPTPMINMVASCVTLEKLYQVMEGFSEVIKGPDGKPSIHSSASFMLADEMGLLFRRKETTADLLMFLIAGYDCTEKFIYDTKQNDTNIIINVCTNFFGCTTPAWISRNFTDDILDLGIGSRILFVWGDTKRQNTTFLKFTPEQEQALNEVTEHFKALNKVSGEMRFSPAAYEWYDNWVQKEQDKYKINKDPKLAYYYSRKSVHLRKMAMLFHFSEKMDLILTEDDFKQALAFLSFLEKDMHRALASINNNPEATLADAIRRAIEDKKGMRRIQIVQDFFGMATDGLKSIEGALGFLQMTGQCALNQNTQLWEVVKESQKLQTPPKE